MRFIDWRMDALELTKDGPRGVRNERFRVNRLILPGSARLAEAPEAPESEHADRPSGKALYLDGHQGRACEGVYPWESQRPFDLSFWLLLTEPPPSGGQVVFSVTGAWELVWDGGVLTAHVYHRGRVSRVQLACPTGSWQRVTLQYRTTGKFRLTVGEKERAHQLAVGQEMDVVKRPIRIGANAFNSRRLSGFIENVTLLVPIEAKRGNKHKFGKDFGRHL